MLYLVKAATFWYCIPNYFKCHLGTMAATSGRDVRKIKKTKDKSPLARLQSLSSWENNWKLIPIILFITAYNLAVVCCNCTFETQLKKEKLNEEKIQKIYFSNSDLFYFRFLIWSYYPASFKFILSSLSTKNIMQMFITITKTKNSYLLFASGQQPWLPRYWIFQLADFTSICCLVQKQFWTSNFFQHLLCQKRNPFSPLSQLVTELGKTNVPFFS